MGVRALAAFNLTCLVDNYTKGQVRFIHNRLLSLYLSFELFLLG